MKTLTALDFTFTPTATASELLHIQASANPNIEGKSELIFALTRLSASQQVLLPPIDKTEMVAVIVSVEIPSGGYVGEAEAPPWMLLTVNGKGQAVWLVDGGGSAGGREKIVEVGADSYPDARAWDDRGLKGREGEL
jgi:hypothetical protein